MKTPQVREYYEEVEEIKKTKGTKNKDIVYRKDYIPNMDRIDKIGRCKVCKITEEEKQDENKWRGNSGFI